MLASGTSSFGLCIQNRAGYHRTRLTSPNSPRPSKSLSDTSRTKEGVSDAYDKLRWHWFSEKPSFHLAISEDWFWSSLLTACSGTCSWSHVLKCLGGIVRN